MRLAGKRSSGSWDTQGWLITKSDAHVEGDTLVGDSDDADEVIAAGAVGGNEEVTPHPPAPLS